MRNNTYIRQATVLFCLVAVLITSGCRRDEVTSVSGIIWGTTYHLTVVGQADENTVAETVTSVLDTLDGSLNAFNPVAEISVFNSKGEITPSADFMTVLRESFAVSRLTGGAFDPTVGPLVDFWGFGSGQAGAPVDTVALAKARSAVGLQNIKVGENRVVSLCPDTRLDFGAIAKGYAVDRVFDALSARFAPIGVMVEIGGEVRVAGVNGEGEPWRIQLDAPVRDTSGRHVRLGVIELTDAAVATSGNYRNFRELPDGRIVAHTISPTTGLPVETDVLSATIIASSAMKADALATAVMVLGSEHGGELLRRLSSDSESGVYGAIFVTADDILTVGLPSAHARFEATTSND